MLLCTVHFTKGCCTGQSWYGWPFKDLIVHAPLHKLCAHRTHRGCRTREPTQMWSSAPRSVTLPAWSNTLRPWVRARATLLKITHSTMEIMYPKYTVSKVRSPMNHKSVSQGIHSPPTHESPGAICIKVPYIGSLSMPDATCHPYV